MSRYIAVVAFLIMCFNVNANQEAPNPLSEVEDQVEVELSELALSQINLAILRVQKCQLKVVCFHDILENNSAKTLGIMEKTRSQYLSQAKASIGDNYEQIKSCEQMPEIIEAYAIFSDCDAQVRKYTGELTVDSSLQIYFSCISDNLEPLEATNYYVKLVLGTKIDKNSNAKTNFDSSTKHNKKLEACYKLLQ